MSNTRSKSANKPKYSILIAVYQHYDYLRHCLDSAIAQPEDLTEIIIVDDGSPDKRVSKLLERYQKKDPGRIRLRINAKNQGIIPTIGGMVNDARGEYVAFLDCDDFLADDAIATVNAHVMKNPQLAYLFSDRNYVDADEKLIETSHYTNSHEITNTSNHVDNLLIEMLATHLKVIKKEAFLKVGGFTEESSGVQDYDVALKMSEVYPIEYIDTPLYNYRIHPNTVTNSRRIEQHIKSGLVLRRALVRRGLVAKKAFKVYMQGSSVSQSETSQFLTLQSMGAEVNVQVADHDGFIAVIPKIGLIDRLFVPGSIMENVKKELKPLLEHASIILEPSSDVPFQRLAERT